MYTEMQGYLAGMPADILSFLGFLWIDHAIGEILSRVYGGDGD